MRIDGTVTDQRALGARTLLTQVDALAERMFKRVLQEAAPAPLLPELSPDLRAAGIAVARADLAHELACFEADELPITCPGEVIETARRTVALGAPLSFPLQCYRVGHRVLWDAWGGWTEPLAPELRDELRRIASDFFFDYAERCCSFLTAAHAAELATARSGLAQRHLALARRTLDGTRRPSHIGDYRIDSLHLAVVISGPGAATAATDAQNVSGRRALRIPLDDETIWLWLDAVSTTDGPTFASRLGVETARPAHVGVGAPAPGLDGFARSHRQAQQALRIALTRGASVVSYDQVALDAVATADERIAEDFAHHILAPVANNSKLMATLVSWIDHDQNAAAAAASLGVSERTVNNRLRTTERKLGRPLRGSATAIEIAIRITHALSRDIR